MRLLVPLAILLAGVVAACGQSPQTSAPEQSTPTRTASDAVTPTPSQPKDTPTPASYFEGAITLELQAPSEVPEWEWLEGLDVVMTNTGEEPFTFYYSGNVLDFEVLNSDNEVIWKWLGASVDPLGTLTLEPGESQIVSRLDWASQGAWDLRDREGFPVEPGTYQVRGVVRFHLQDPSIDRSEERLETAVHLLSVEDVPLPDDAQAIEVELIAPSEARVGEPIPLDLRMTNTGERPLALLWSGHNQAPRFHHSDIVIFRDGKLIWRMIDAHDIRGWGIVTLEPGQSQTMSSISFVTGVADGDGFKGDGEPWAWDQRSDCDLHHGFRSCPTPVEPGTYTIRGVINVSPPETLGQEPPFTPERSAIATEPHELVITR